MEINFVHMAIKNGWYLFVDKACSAASLYVRRDSNSCI